jgi:hypothetical protein
MTPLIHANSPITPTRATDPASANTRNIIH